MKKFLMTTFLAALAFAPMTATVAEAGGKPQSCKSCNPPAQKTPKSVSAGSSGGAVNEGVALADGKKSFATVGSVSKKDFSASTKMGLKDGKVTVEAKTEGKTSTAGVAAAAATDSKEASAATSEAGAAESTSEVSVSY